MFRRSMSVVYRPLKNNYVVLPESYFRLVSTYESGCLNLTYNYGESIHLSWAPYAGVNLHDTEIGMNSTAAQAIGLKDGSIVKCLLIPDVCYINKVNVSPLSQKDWETLELSSERIQSTLLEQTKIVNNGQKLVVWLNKSIFITLKIDSLTPNVLFGKIENNTELIVAPFQDTKRKPSTGTKSRGTSLYVPQTNTFVDNLPELSPSSRMNSLSKSTTLANVTTLKSSNKFEVEIDYLNQLIKDFKKDNTKSFQFRVISGKWDKSPQINDLFITKSNLPDSFDIDQVYMLRSVDNREYYVNVKLLPDKKNLSENIYPAIEINENLMKILGIKRFERIMLKPKHTVLNFIERIDLLPRNSVNYKQLKDIEQLFKHYVLNNTKLLPLLINQDQVIKLNNDTIITAKLYPETFKYCLMDCDILRESKIFTVETVKNIDNYVSLSDNEDGTKDEETGRNLVKVMKFDEIVSNCVDTLKYALCLDDRNKYRKMENLLIIGASNSGKSTICDKILSELLEKPFFCYYDIFFCARNKGRKPESIMRDLRHIFMSCLSYSPSILLLDNLDILTKTGAEHTQDGDYYNKVSDIIHSLILEFTISNAISVIATVSSVNSLNKRLYMTRGRHLFQKIIKISDLDKSDREVIINELCNKCKGTDKKLNVGKFAILTEGYNIGDLVQFIERAIFYACKEDPNFPQLTDKILTESLKMTNSYCLQGIENHNLIDEDDDENDPPTDKIPGLENAIDVLEEVLMWPSKFPKIFENSPLRNQAGVLLFGPPGTGKTYLVSQIAKAWNLRMISVKGPELLAKYIGQSEENVRNLFDRARSAKPCVLFFDEFDSLAPRRGHDSTGVTDRVVNQLLTELDGVEGLQGVTVIGASSRPDLLDPALLRSGRIDRLVECVLPNKESRLNIFKKLSRSVTLADDVDLKYFAEKSNNFTGADIQSVITSANMIAIKECLTNYDEKIPLDIPDRMPIKQKHFLDAFNNTRPSLSQQDIVKYKQLYAKFTNKEKPSRDFVAKRATLA